jgi:probable rRNA maturation factor
VTAIEVDIEEPAWLSAAPDARDLVTKAALAALGGRAEGEVAALLADDERIRALNRDFRSKDQATNVLSFPAPASARPHLGDVVLAFGVCAKEAEDQGKSIQAHLLHLTIHGVLHLLGYDHETDADAAVMEALERTLLAGFDVADPYAVDRADDRP